MNTSKQLSSRAKRQRRVRHKLSSSPRPRLTVFRSSAHIYAQLLEPTGGKVICAVSTKTKDLKSSIAKLNKVDAAKKVGEAIGKLAKEKGVEEIVFDRSGYLYHGRIKSLADGARESGLKF